MNDDPPLEMSGDGTPRPARTDRVVIPLAVPPPPATVPSLATHARRFLLALAGLVGLGALLLASPWTTESGETTPPIDALFTAVSAASVTGLASVETASHWNWFGEAVILILMQAGGLSFAVGASLVLQALRRQTSLRDTLLLRDGEPTLSVGEATSLARRILRFTLIVQAVGALALALRFLVVDELSVSSALWHGLFLAVGAFTNAGFDLSGNFSSLVPYQTSIWVNLVIGGLIQAGALSFLVFSDLWQKRSWRRLTLDTKLILVMDLALIVVVAAMLIGVEWSRALASAPAWARPMAALFLSVSTRSGGFTTVDLGEANAASIFVMIVSMAIGGAPASTAGGVRLTTVAVIGVAVLATLRGQSEPHVFGRRIAITLVLRAIAVVFLFLAAHAVATVALALTENVAGGDNLGFIDLMFEAMSALATDGLSTGVTPGLTTAGKVVLCITMFLGRVGPLTVVYALQRRLSPDRHRFPEEPVRIG